MLIAPFMPASRWLGRRRGTLLRAVVDTLPLRLIKIAARVVETKTKIKVYLPTSAPDQTIWHLVLDRLPRFVI